jgi:23S rRNA (uridine2552-2'-O)-methyltransferase
VFKLREIDERWHLLKQGQRVLDLGAAPGSWSKYAAERVGARGRVVAVDLQDIPASLGSNVVVVKGDVLRYAGDATSSPPEEGVSDPVLAGAPYAVVLSDMAPSTTGSKSSDQARSHDLFMRALELATRLGEKGGAFVGKIFMSGDFQLAKQAVAARFETCRVLKPEGTRKNSTEIYVVGTGFRGTTASG